jgi:hypothetical protein
VTSSKCAVRLQQCWHILQLCWEILCFARQKELPPSSTEVALFRCIAGGLCVASAELPTAADRSAGQLQVGSRLAATAPPRAAWAQSAHQQVLESVRTLPQRHVRLASTVQVVIEAR